MHDHTPQRQIYIAEMMPELINYHYVKSQKEQKLTVMDIIHQLMEVLGFTSSLYWEIHNTQDLAQKNS